MEMFSVGVHDYILDFQLYCLINVVIHLLHLF